MRQEDKMTNLKIFVCHTPGDENVLPQSSNFVHVLGGAALNNAVSRNLVRDDTGDNISAKNKSYCELTVQYWAWKNADADYYGFCHYRRYFCFNQPEKQSPDRYANVAFDFFDDGVLSQIIADSDIILEKMKGSPVALTTLFDVRNIDIRNIHDHYKSDPCLHDKDIDVLLEVIYDISPEYYPAAMEHLNDYFFYSCNMFIMKKEIFFRYCEWLFLVLAECERRIDASKYSVEELRFIGHLSERCLGIFCTWLNKNMGINAVFFQRLFIKQPGVGIKPYPKSENPVTIVTASNDYYVPYMSVMLQSLFGNISKGRNYEIFILHTDISEENIKKIIILAGNYQNVFLKFYNVSKDVAPFVFLQSENLRHISKETFYRLLIPKIFSNYKNILYLDGDIIIKTDVTPLHDTDIGNNLLGACLDADFIGNCCSIPDFLEYARTILRIENFLFYFQAGVLLLNIKRLNEIFGEDELAKKAAVYNYKWQDQDVLNICCYGRTYFLDLHWNVMVQHKWNRIAVIAKTPFPIYNQYLESRKAPKIIHYAGAQKPWTDPVMDFSEDFWHFARQSPFYELILRRMNGCPPSLSPSAVEKANVITKSFLLLFPYGSKRRKILKRIYYKFKRP